MTESIAHPPAVPRRSSGVAEMSTARFALPAGTFALAESFDRLPGPWVDWKPTAATLDGHEVLEEMTLPRVCR